MSDRSVERRFSAAAHSYDEVAEVQAQVARTLAEMMPAADRVSRVLEIGCGTGTLTEQLVDRYPTADLDALDISAAMIDEAQARVPHASIRWIAEDFLAFSPTSTYDLIASSSSLHWMTPLDATFARIQQHLSAGGQFWGALMLRDTFKELHDLRDTLFPEKRDRPRLPAAEDIQALLPAGARLEVSTLHTPIHNAASFFSSLHRLGVTGGPFARVPLRRGELQQLMQAFDASEVRWQVGFVSWD